MTQRPPFIFRLMLCSLFLPIIIGLCVLLYTLFFEPPDDNFWSHQGTMFGVPSTWLALALILLPFALWLWMLRSGNWRRPVLTAAVVYAVSFVLVMFELVEEQVPPDKRIINLYGNNGADVYCNGVHLGQTPLKIRVDELTAKVPQWDTPPEQRWYDDTDLEQILCTWSPWDDFRRERFEASKKLYEVNRNVSSTTSKAVKARREALLQHNAGCRYWWSYKIGDTQMAFRQRGGSYNLDRSFDKKSDYYFHEMYLDTSFSPSVNFHVQLLTDVLPELTPEQKADWDKQVLKHWQLLAQPLKRNLNWAETRHRRDKNEGLAELCKTALHSTARLKYALSNPPTEDECRRLLADWIKESIDDHNVFNFSYRDEERYPPEVSEDVLIPADINETMRKPLAEQWKKNKYRSENGWAPVAYFSAQNKSPDYFADFARWSATTGKARFALLDNESPNTVALFNTLLNRRSISELFTWQIYLYPAQIKTYSQVDNPLVESDMREYIVKALSDPHHDTNTRNAVEWAVTSAIFQRIDRENINKDDFSAWMTSLPLAASTKNLALRMLRFRSDGPLTFAEQLQKAAGRSALIETELTLDDAVKWFAENPGEGDIPTRGSLLLFLEAQEETITVNVLSDNSRNYYDETYSSTLFGNVVIRENPRNQQRWNDDMLAQSFVLALLRCDTPEGDPRVRELIRRIWKRSAHLVEKAISTEYGYGTVSFRRDRWYEFAVGAGSIYLPEYILDLYLSPENEAEVEVVGIDGKKEMVKFGRGMGSTMASTLALCESPKAGEILEKWVNEASGAERPHFERHLELWRTRDALRQRKMEVFQDLIAGRKVPDDLLLVQPVWIWKDGKYVQ
ncbi:MAG: cbb3-type cytochrome c oxidase subunit I, partial [Planctomycetaceae bacterium]|nr:cbb3-type cytochrome c oxidase subunit I [Planctomycetaceae bacterium]